MHSCKVPKGRQVPRGLDRGLEGVFTPKLLPKGTATSSKAAAGQGGTGCRASCLFASAKKPERLRVLLSTEPQGMPEEARVPPAQSQEASCTGCAQGRQGRGHLQLPFTEPRVHTLVCCLLSFDGANHSCASLAPSQRYSENQILHISPIQEFFWGVGACPGD